MKCWIGTADNVNVVDSVIGPLISQNLYQGNRQDQVLGWGAGKAGDKIGYFPLKYVAA